MHTRPLLKINLIKTVLCTVFLFIGSVLVGSKPASATNVSGVVSGTWTAANSPYVVTGSISVSSGTTLTIDAGVTVKFPSNVIMQVYGSVDANGTSTDPIFFTSNAGTPAAGDWYGIQFNSGSTGDFTYTTFRYGGKHCTGSCTLSDKMISNEGGTLTFSDCSFLTSLHYALHQTSGDSSFSGGLIDANVDGVYYNSGTIEFTNGATIKDSIKAQVGATSLTVSDSAINTGDIDAYVPFTFTDNTLTNAVISLKKPVNFTHSGNTVISGIKGYYLSGSTGGNATLPGESEMAYIINSPLSVSSGHTLTFGEGAVIKITYASDGAISVNGTLVTEGTSLAPVYITSYKDDAAGGDTNNDSTATTPVAGDWYSIVFNSGSTGTFAYTTIRYGANKCTLCAPNKMVSNLGGTLTFEDSSLTNSKYYAIYQTAGSTSMSGGLVQNNPNGIYYDSGTMLFSDGVEIKSLIDARQTATSLSFIGSYLNTGVIDSYVSSFTFTNNTLNNATVRLKRLSKFVHTGNTVTDGVTGYYLSGQTSGDATLDAESGMQYAITDGFTVLAGHTLTIDEGVILKFHNFSSAYLSVSGDLEVKGASTSRVYFTSYKDDTAGGDTLDDGATTPTYGDWHGIKFTSGAVGNFTNAVIRYGGKVCSSCTISSKMIWNDGANLTFTDSDLLSSLHYAIYQDTTDSGTVAFSAGTVDNNIDGIYYDRGAMTFMDGALVKNKIDARSTAKSLTFVDCYLTNGQIDSYVPFTFTGNYLSGASVNIKKFSTFIHYGNTVTSGIPAYYINATTSGDNVLGPESGIVYVTSGFSISSGHSLTFEPGSIIKLNNQNALITVNGTLNINGIASNPVYFTSYKDDSIGGDTNNNGASSGVAGDWGKFDFASGSTGNITHAVIRYGGYNSIAANKYMVLNEGGTVKITDTDITNSYLYGFYSTSGTTTILASTLTSQSYGAYITNGTVTFQGASITSNSTTGVFVTGGTVSLNGSTISGNTSYGVYSTGTSIDAEGNYWGASSGPYNATYNPSGTGNAVANAVDFTPYETVALETTAPSVSITSPIDDDVRLSATATVEGTVSDGGSGVAAVRVNGVLCSTDSGDWTCTGVPVTPGENTLAASAWDNHGNRADASVTIERKVPVILLPGIGGSHLYSDTDSDLGWLDVDDMFWGGDDQYLTDRLALTSNGLSIDSVRPIDVIRTVTLDDYPIKDIYNGFIGELVENNGYLEYPEEQKSLFVFPYDWRLDLRDTSSSLSTKIDDVLLATGSDQVDIVAHSMGGLLAKQYIHDYGTQSIRKIVFVGTPHLGSPQAAKALLFGTDFGINDYTPEFFQNFPLNEDRIREIAFNSPAVYELLPTSKYISDITEYIYVIDPPNSTKLSYVQSAYYLKNDRSLNSGLVDEGAEFHTQKLDYIDYGTIQAYDVAACASDTVGAYQFDESGDIAMLGKLGGDGTVPYQSANFGAIPHKYYETQSDAEHGGLVSRGRVRQAIAEILTGIGTTALSALDDDTSNCGDSGQSLTWMSPVDVHIYDSDGRHTGPNENGGIDRQIPGVSYQIINHHKFVFLPANNLDYSVLAVGTDDGTFDLRLSTYVKDHVTSTEIFNDIPVKINTTVELARKGSKIDRMIRVTDPESVVRLYRPFTTGLESGAEADLKRPNTEISSVNEGADAISIGLKAFDLGSGVAAIYYSVDGASYDEYVGPIRLKNEEKHTIRYYAVDRAGNDEKPNIYETSARLDTENLNNITYARH